MGEAWRYRLGLGGGTAPAGGTAAVGSPSFGRETSTEVELEFRGQGLGAGGLSHPILHSGNRTDRRSDQSHRAD